MSFIAPNVRMKGTASSGTAAQIGNLYVKIQSVDLDKRVAHVIDQVKANRTVQFTHMIGKGVGFPAVGETWLISSQFGPWMFVAQVAADIPTFVQDDDSRLSDARTPTGPAGGALGGTYPNPTIPAPSPRYVGTVGQPAFQNGWANYDAAGVGYQDACFYKDAAGIVYVKGLVKGGTVSTTSASSAIFTLPVGYRPSGTLIFSALCGGPGVARVDVQLTTGYVNVNSVAYGATGGDNTLVSLSNISFLAEA